MQYAWWRSLFACSVRMIPSAVPWPDVASEPVLQCVRTDSGQSEEALYCCCNQAAPCAPMEVLLCRSFSRMVSAALIYAFRMAVLASGCASPSISAARMASWRVIAFERSTAVESALFEVVETRINVRNGFLGGVDVVFSSVRKALHLGRWR